MDNVTKKPPFFLVIAGNIGVGKSFLAEILQKRLGWQAYFEKEGGNPYLANFYQDMRQWSFHAQIFFLTQHFKSHLTIRQSAKPVIQVHSIFEDAEVFTASLYRLGLICERDYQTYRSLYETVLQSLSLPDMIVYLRASPWTLLSRIRKQWQAVERNVDKEYLFQLNLAYERWIQNFGEKVPVHVVETDTVDLSNELAWAYEVAGELKKYCDRQGVTYRMTEIT